MSIREGDMVVCRMVGRDPVLIKVAATASLTTEAGELNHADIIGKPFGTCVETSEGEVVFLLRPTAEDYVVGAERNSPVNYPKEISRIIFRLGIGSGSRVLEVGTGSGAMTTALAHAVGPDGHVYSYDVRQDMLDCTESNLKRAGLADRVELKKRQFQAPFDESELDAATIDVMKPWRELKQVWEALRDGGYLGCTVLTYNQLETLAESMPEERFLPLESMEILCRALRPRNNTTRPKYEMLGHTHLLQFGVKVAEPVKRDREYELLVRYGNEEYTFQGGMPAWRLLERLDVLPDTVLVLRNGAVVTHEERLKPGDDIEIVSVVSGD